MRLLWFELAALALLIALLVWRCWQHAKRFARKGNALPPGHGFDALPVQARLKSVRRDYRAVAALRQRRNPNHDLIVMAVRHTLARLSYFRSAQASRTETTERGLREGGGLSAGKSI